MALKPQLKLLMGAWHLLWQIMAFGNRTFGGFQNMDEALRAVAVLNKFLKEKFGIEIAVSAHLFHELLVPANAPHIGRYAAKLNSPRAISLKRWMQGYKKGYYPPIGRIIPAGFGYPWSDEGAFINPNSEYRQFSHDLMVYAFRLSEMVKEEGVGEGDVIYWDGPDGLIWRRLVEGDDVLLGYDLNPCLREWKMIIAGVTQAVQAARAAGCTNTKLLFESKPGGDPCYLGIFTDTYLEIQGIRQMNQILGADVVEWQGEFCHTRGSGQTFASAMREAIEAEVFGGRFHANAGGIGQTYFSKMLGRPGGTPASSFPQYVDNDFPWGSGVKEWLKDQRKTMEIGTVWSARTGLPLEVEFDMRVARDRDTIGTLRKSAIWTIDEFNRAAKKIAA